MEEDWITPDTSLMDDLKADDLDIVELVITLELEFDIEIPDEDAENPRRVISNIRLQTATTIWVYPVI